MKVIFGLLALALLVVQSQPEVRSHIVGRVEILDKGGVKRKIIQDVVVYVDGLKAPVPDELLSREIRISSRNKTFAPHVETVPVGAEVSFPNFDDIMHNVFSVSRGNQFDLGLYKSGARKSRQFEKPGVVRIYCNIHPQMSAFLLVMENPYFTWAEPDGSFRIENLPVGSHTVTAWHEQAQVSAKVVVGNGGVDEVELILDASRYKAKPHLNKFGEPYSKKRKKY